MPALVIIQWTHLDLYGNQPVTHCKLS